MGIRDCIVIATEFGCMEWWCSYSSTSITVFSKRISIQCWEYPKYYPRRCRENPELSKPSIPKVESTGSYSKQAYWCWENPELSKPSILKFESIELFKASILMWRESWVIRGKHTDGWQYPELFKASILKLREPLVIWDKYTEGWENPR